MIPVLIVVVCTVANCVSPLFEVRRCPFELERSIVINHVFDIKGVKIHAGRVKIHYFIEILYEKNYVAMEKNHDKS